MLTTLLISVTIANVQLLFFAFKDRPQHAQDVIDCLTILFVFILLSFFSKKNRKKIEDDKLNMPYLGTVHVIIIYVFAIGVFICLSNINREKIFKERGKSINPHKKQSLEGEIRGWFNR